MAVKSYIAFIASPIKCLGGTGFVFYLGTLLVVNGADVLDGSDKRLLSSR